tara:strand:+ start:263 stop:760 length:498 start_codon:yes stop_codon:yes gene_type:complete
MQSTKPSLNEQESGQSNTDASSSSSQSETSRFDGLIESLKGNKISNSKLREEVFNILLDDATESPETGKYYTFEYDPKFADKLKEWDEYPLVYVMEFKKDNLIGANIHYIRGTNSRLKALNNKRFPKRTYRQYIPKRADSIFFEISEDEVQLLSTLPLEKFNYNR